MKAAPMDEIENPTLLDWQKELLDQRLRDADTHPEDWVSWEEVRKRLEEVKNEGE